MVEPEFIQPERLIYFGNVPRGKEAIKETVISIAQDRPVELVSAESSDASVTVKLEPVPDSNNKKVKLIATQKADAKEGFHGGMIVIKTTSTYTPELRISVRGNVVASQSN
jgi:uncharacterized protein (DUF302 family)